LRIGNSVNYNQIAYAINAKGNIAVTKTKDTINSLTNIFQCADRVSPGDNPRNITSIKEKYIPFDVSHQETYLRRNPFGAVIYRQHVLLQATYY